MAACPVTRNFLKPHQPHSRCDCNCCPIGQSGSSPARGLERVTMALGDVGDESGETDAESGCEV